MKWHNVNPGDTLCCIRRLRWNHGEEMDVISQRKIIKLPETESTNDQALKSAQLGEAAGTVVVAASQTAGRGRLGKQWVSPPGTGLYFSLILRPELPLADVPKVTLAAGLGVAEALDPCVIVPVKLKWPNDLLLDGKKCAGILCESHIVGPLDELVIIVGIGCNLTTPLSTFPPDIAGRVTSLSYYAHEDCDWSSLMEGISCQVEKQVRRLEERQFGNILADWRKRDATLGRELEWLGIKGTRIRGVSLGPDDEGVLHIRDDTGTIHGVLSGDLSLILPVGEAKKHTE